MSFRNGVKNRIIILLVIILATLSGLWSQAVLDDSLNSLDHLGGYTGELNTLGGAGSHDSLINMAAGDRNALAVADPRIIRSGSNHPASITVKAFFAVFGSQTFSMPRFFYEYAAVACFAFLLLVYIYYIHLSDGNK